MTAFFEKNRQRILPLLLALAVLALLSLPLAVNPAWAAPGTSPDHVLTYNQNSLRWDSATGINADGTAELRLFDANYNNVEAVDGRKVVAPGTDGSNMIRLVNNVSGRIRYTAVLYSIKTDPRIPVQPSLGGTGMYDTASYQLPAGVTGAEVIRAVRGTVAGHGLQDFNIDWNWLFEVRDAQGVTDAQDVTDTELGNAAAAAMKVQTEGDSVTVGFYIVVVDSNNYYVPKTGDESHIAMYLAFMLIAAAGAAVSVVIYRRHGKCER